MVRIEAIQVTGDNGDPEDAGRRAGRRKAVRFAVPLVAAGVAAATVGLVPALASAGSPSLPDITAQQLVEKIAASDTQTVTGTVKFTTDLGLPSLLTGAASGGGSSPFAGATSAATSGKSGSSAADPQQQLTQLLAGSHTLRIAADGPEKQKVSIIENAAEYSVIHSGDEVWAYDSKTNSAYHATAPKGTVGAQQQKKAPSSNLPTDFPTTPKEAAQQALKAAGTTTSVTVDGTAKIAGRDAYQLLIKPKQSGTTVGSIRIAVDSATGVPLKFTLLPKGSGKAVFDVGFTKVDFGKPAASTFAFTPPKGAKVTTEKADGSGSALKDLQKHNEASAQDALSGLNVLGQGWSSIAVIKSDTGSGTSAAGKGSANSALSDFGKAVHGNFGSGTLVSTRLVNALITDKGTVYVGAVSQDALVKAADAAAK
jgi:outer membrane lipoprotein-sorting protein